MNMYGLIQRILDKQDDYNFKVKWEKWFMHRFFQHILGIVIIWSITVIIMGIIMNAQVGFLYALFMMSALGFIFGYFMIVHFMKFFAKNSERYMRIIMNQQSNVINYDNVVN